MRHLVLLYFLLLPGCPKPTPGPVPPGPPLPSAEDCDAAQANLEKVCPSKAKTPAKKDFSVLCKEDAAKTPPINLNPKCVATVKSCEEFDKCTQSN